MVPLLNLKLNCETNQSKIIEIESTNKDGAGLIFKTNIEQLYADYKVSASVE